MRRSVPTNRRIVHDTLQSDAFELALLPVSCVLSSSLRDLCKPCVFTREWASAWHTRVSSGGRRRRHSNNANVHRPSTSNWIL